MNLKIINGPNLNLLGKREPDIYGNDTFEEYLRRIKNDYEDINIDYFQSNIEGEIINELQASEKYTGIIINGGGYSHTSVAIRDAISSIDCPTVEVHISNIYSREEFRNKSLLSAVCCGCIIGFGLKSYELAIDYFIKINRNDR